MKGFYFMDIRELFLDPDDDRSKEYKSGWDDAVCYIMDNYKIETRNGEPIQICFDTKIDEDLIIEKILEAEQKGEK